MAVGGRRPGPYLMIALAPAFALLAVTGYLTAIAIATPVGLPPRELSLEALRKLPPGELADTLSEAQAAFVRNPLDSERLIQLSRVLQARGEEEAAQRLTLMAGRMQPRSLQIQAEALEIMIQRRDFEGAMTSLDGLIRARPQRARLILAVAADIAADPEGRSALVSTLAGRPPWRAQFIAETLRSGRPDLARQVMSDLRAMGLPPTAPEVSALVKHYLAAGAVDDAYAVWLSSLSAEELNRVGLVFDGGFGGDIRNLSFDWTIQPARGMSYRLFPRNTASMDMSLQIDFADFPSSFANLSQILRLSPGRYRLRGETRIDGMQPLTEFLFRIHCREQGRGRMIDETPPLPLSSQWITFEKTFTVPPTDCRDQILSLESRKDAGSAKINRGQLALDNIAIERLPDLAP